MEDQIEDEEFQDHANREMKDPKPWGRRRRRGGSWFRQKIVKPALSFVCSSECNKCANNNSAGCKLARAACKC